MCAEFIPIYWIMKLVYALVNRFRVNFDQIQTVPTHSTVLLESLDLDHRPIALFNPLNW